MIFGNQAARFARQGVRSPIDFRRGGRAVDCTGLENRQAERPREFESHPLRHIDSQALILRAPKNITDRHNKPSEFSLVRPCSRTSRQFRPERIRGFGKVALCWSASTTMPQFAAKADRTPARNSSPPTCWAAPMSRSIGPRRWARTASRSSWARSSCPRRWLRSRAADAPSACT